MHELRYGNTIDAAHGRHPMSKLMARHMAGPARAARNAILAGLSRHDLDILSLHLEPVALPLGLELFEYGGRLDHVYFPTSAIVSLVHVMADGATTELAVVGSEGVVGVSMFMSERAMCSALVQSAGYGYRLPSALLRQALHEGGDLPLLLLRYSNALFAQMAQNAVGVRHSSIEQNLCRWLLERLDRSATNDVNVTHTTIALMLGVRRESITMAAGNLQDDGLIQYSRGKIKVIDRRGLERHAGECYHPPCVQRACNG